MIAALRSQFTTMNSCAAAGEDRIPRPLAEGSIPLFFPP
jgi:hypothetical protein